MRTCSCAKPKLWEHLTVFVSELEKNWNYKISIANAL